MRFDSSGCNRWYWLLTALAIAGCGGSDPVPRAQPDAARSEQQLRAFVEAMKPRRTERPVIVVLARNGGTETTDFLLTHAVLQRAGVAEVHAVAPRRGRVSLYPVLEVDVAEDLASFDRAHPSGADYVIVPAMDDEAEPAITGWLQAQAQRGARVIGVCAGALIVGHAGLLDGRRFTTHWFFRDDIRERQPGAVSVPHQRYVVAGDGATTRGIWASVPAMLALVEAIAGQEKARTLAGELGVEAWTPAHDSSQFKLDGSRRWNYVISKIAFWRHERWAVDVRDGIDDIALAFAADAWSRTGYVDVVAAGPKSVRLRSGLMLAGQQVPEGTARLPLAAALEPVRQLDRTLCEIAARYGDAARDRVQMELEYPAPARACGR